MQEKVLKTLEYDKIAEMLKAKTVTCAGAELAEGMEPYDTFDKVKSALAFTAEAETVIIRTGRSPVDSFPDMRECLKRIHAALFVSPSELMGISRCLRVSRLAREAIEREENVPLLSNLAGYISTHRSVEEEIDRCILGEEEIFDGASPELSRIRRSMRQTNDKVRERLGSMIRSAAYSKYLQEPLITIRNGRFVIPVKQEYRQNVPGLIHDQSGSGATLFIEPAAVVELGNQYKKLIAEEQQEIERILSELTAMVAPYGGEINENIRILGEMDLAFAKAKLARDMNATEPKLNHTGYIRIVQGRHPLIPKETVRPIDIWLGRDFRTLIITGPNTGGKTVTLKTVGLFVLMTQSGMFIPADIGSEISVFDSVYADIGDEQSIEQNLSTFSAHMTNIVHILGECDADSLLLFDELGAGTDPTEGAALAIAVIEHARKLGADVAATTHYAELKVYATNENGIQNASCEFDVETLSPTYRLLVGVPGKSNAFAISERLGLSKDIIDDAKARIGVQNASFEATIEKLEQTRAILERDRAETAKKLREAEESAKKAAFLRAELSVRLEKADEKARRDAERIISDVRRTAEDTFAELDEMRRKMNEDEQAQEVNRARSELRRKLNESQSKVKAKQPEKPAEDKKSAREVRAGDTVEIKSMGVKAEVIDVNPDGTLNLRAGIMNVKLKPDDVYLIEGHAAKQKKQSVTLAGSTAARAAVSPEIDLRGMESIEAVNAAEQYIDSAVMGKLKTVTIIHGKGTGALRAAVQQMLKRNKAVKSYRLGRFGEGESGVTIVELK